MIWALLLYNLVVVVWGVYVRASFSGAGCGAHWPVCGGINLQADALFAQRVELAHRISSGVALVLNVGLFVRSLQLYPKGSPVRFTSAMVALFTVSEALIGAALVLFKWVAHNPSLVRAVAVAAHLTNTFVLLAAIAATLWCAEGGKAPTLKGQGRDAWLIGIGLVAITLWGITGTFSALGDMLYPSSSILAGMKQDFAPTANYLLRLRPIHPFAAILVALYIGGTASVISKSRPLPAVKVFRRSIMYIFAFQLILGFVNLMLHAPVWLQLQHLLLADILWINFVLFGVAALSYSATGNQTDNAAKLVTS